MSNNNAGYDVVVDVDEEVCAVKSSYADRSNAGLYPDVDATATTLAEIQY